MSPYIIPRAIKRPAKVTRFWEDIRTKSLAVKSKMRKAGYLILQKILIKSLCDLCLIKVFPAIKKLNLCREFFHEQIFFQKTFERQAIPV